MVYLTVTAACLDGRCDECDGSENMPEPSDEFVCGGGSCVHPCHGRFNPELSAEVERDVRAIREKSSS